MIKKGLEVFTPSQVGTIRISFAFLFFLPFAVRHIRQVSREKYKFIFFTGLVGNLIPAVLFALAETKLESSLTGILNALSPLFTLLVAIYFFKFEISGIQVAGIIIGFIGTIGLSFVGAGGGIGGMNVYVWIVVAATICYALSLNFIKEYLSGISPAVITSLAMLSVGPFSLIYLFTTDFPQRLVNLNGAYESLAYLAILGIFGTAIGLILYTKLVLMTTAVFASSVTYLIPIVAVIWGVFDNESLYPLHLAGMFLIFAGIYFVNRFNYTKT